MNETIKQLKDFFLFAPRKAQKIQSLTPSEDFLKLGQKTALEVFRIAAKTVPAYKDFLKKNKIDPAKIKNFADFTKVPLTNKENYLFKYRLDKLLIGGNFRGKFAFSSSSGSSGKPFYWPRFSIQDIGGAKSLESLLVNSFDIDKKSTLHLNCAGMGIWTAGDMNGLMNKYISYKYGHNCSISPGIDLDNVLRIVQDVGVFFKQIVFYGYPPFLKDIVDNLSKDVLQKMNLKFVAYGEPFSESWRDYILQAIKAKSAHKSVVSLLGSSEGGIVGTEEANSVIVRREVQKNPNLGQALFGEERIPSLVQYVPQSKYIEIIDSQLIFTNKSALPLIRYDTKDYGGSLSAEKIDAVCREIIKKSFFSILKRKKIFSLKLPYVYVFGRSDYSATIYGVLIGPDFIKEALLSPQLARILSGKFVMSSVYDKNSNQQLKIVCEKKKNLRKSVDPQIVSELIAEKLKEFSTEYKKLSDSMGKRVLPKIEIRPFDDKEYFSSRNKQKYLEV